MIRDYIVGQTETLTLVPIGQADGSNQFIKVDGVLVNGFSDLTLYTDAAGSSPVPGGDYSETTIDVQWTADEAQAGGTGKTVHSQFQVTNATYHGIDLWATITNFGTYTSNDAIFNQQGGLLSVTSTGSYNVPEGYRLYTFEIDTTLGDVTPEIGGGKFHGQQVLLKETGGGNKARIKGSGFYLGADSGGMYLVNRSILCTWNANGSEWEMDDCVTAEWVDGSWRIFVHQSGIIVQDYYAASPIGTSGTASHPVSLSILSKKTFGYRRSGATLVTISEGTPLANVLTQTDFLLSIAGTGAESVYIGIKGTY